MALLLIVRVDNTQMDRQSLRPMNMRKLTDHVTPGNQLNESIKIEVRDEPGAGGACHRYDITGFDTTNGTGNPSATAEDYRASFSRTIILFQNGAIKDVGGVNGVSQEALLAIVIDRLRGFQSGEFKTRENAVALTHLETALLWLHKRTIDRMNRGVEGTNQK